MSTSFQVYPRNGKVPSVKDISSIASVELAKILKGLGINKNISISFSINRTGTVELIDDTGILMDERKGHFYINVPEFGFSCFVSYRQHEKEHYWHVDGQDLLKGFIAGALGKCTDGLIDSGDGAWDSKSLPIQGSCFSDTFAKLDSIKDREFQRWWEQNYVIDLIYKHDGNLIYPIYQTYEVKRTAVESRLKYLDVNNNTLVVMESDLLQQLYFVCPEKEIKCDKEKLYKLFEKFDWLAWSRYYYDFNPRFESGIDDGFQQEFLSQIVTCESLDKINFRDIWINDNFKEVNSKENIRKILCKFESNKL